MEKQILKLTEKLKALNGVDELSDLLSKVDSLILNNQQSKQLLQLRADLFIKMQKPAKAINDFKAILELDPDNSIAKFQVEHLKTILKFNNTDIYANPNTNLDPWLD